MAAHTGSTNLKRRAKLLQSINQFGMLVRRKKDKQATQFYRRDRKLDSVDRVDTSIGFVQR